MKYGCGIGGMIQSYNEIWLWYWWDDTKL